MSPYDAVFVSLDNYVTTESPCPIGKQRLAMMHQVAHWALTSHRTENIPHFDLIGELAVGIHSLVDPKGRFSPHGK
jgi:hypothetical protein